MAVADQGFDEFKKSVNLLDRNVFSRKVLGRAATLTVQYSR